MPALGYKAISVNPLLDTLPNCVLGVGTDMESIVRFELDENKLKTLTRFFTEAELNYCLSKAQPAQHLAGRFAGKEAVLKALNSILPSAIPLQTIEITNHPDGRPLVSVNFPKLPPISIFLSISHCDAYALAFALVTSNASIGE